MSTVIESEKKKFKVIFFLLKNYRKIMTSLSNSTSKYIVFSYPKNHQELVLKIYHHLKNENLPVWIDIQDGINNNIYQRYLTRTKTNFFRIR